MPIDRGGHIDRPGRPRVGRRKTIVDDRGDEAEPGERGSYVAIERFVARDEPAARHENQQRRPAPP